MPYRVYVELKDGAVCHMAKKSFNVFLSLGKVARFERSNGWIDVEKGPLRDLTRKSDYPVAADRRDLA